MTHWYKLAADGSSDKDYKLLPVLVRQVDKVSGLTATSLLDMPNINSGSTAQQMRAVCYEVREGFSLDWNNCVNQKKQNAHSENTKSDRLPKDF